MVDLTYLKSNVFPGESGGDYNALFGYANRQGQPFQDVRLTDMTINQVLDFTDPSGPYAQSVKGQIGRVATPTGAYQVVGSTLRDAVRGLGLTGDETYNEATQDKIGQWIYQNQGPQAWEAWGGGNGNGGNTVRGSSRNFSGGPDLEPEQTGLLGFITDPEKRARLALALSGMALNPNQAVQALAKDKLATAETGRINNRTAEWLSQRGRGDLAEAVMRGIVPAKEAVTQAMQPEPQADPMGRLVSAAELRQMFPGEQIEDGLYSIKPDGTASKVGGGGTNIYTGDTGTLSKKLDENEAAILGAYASAGAQASGIIGDLQMLDEVMTMAPQGPIVGRLANAFQGVSSAADAAQSIIKRVAPTLRLEGSGATSDIEYNGMLQSLPSIVNSPEANRAISAMMQAKAQINVERAQIVRAFQNSDRSPQATAAMRAALGELDSRSIVTPELRAILGGLSGAPATGGTPAAGAAPVTVAPRVRVYNPATGQLE